MSLTAEWLNQDADRQEQSGALPSQREGTGVTARNKNLALRLAGSAILRCVARNVSERGGGLKSGPVRSPLRPIDGLVRWGGRRSG